MDRLKFKKFHDIIGGYSDIEHLLYKIYYHGAPTISGMKPSSLICFKNNNAIKLKDIWDENKVDIKALIHLDTFELKRSKECVSILFYDKDSLMDTIQSDDIQSFLHTLGYKKDGSLEELLYTLRDNFRCNCPDEIGIFLGYPLSDVIAFRSEDKENSLLVGYWRVYSSVNEAKKKFEAYDQARLRICDILNQGTSPLDLVM